VPYVGCGVLASALAMDKLIAQRLLTADGIPTIPTLGVTAATAQDAAAFAESVGYPVFVKPNRSGSSVGVTRVSSQQQLDSAIRLALEHDRYALVQPAVSGDELDVGVLQLPGGELTVGAPLRVVATHKEFLDYESKYTEGGATLEVPARIPQHVADRLADLAQRAFTSLDCDGLARIDFFVEADGNVLLNEVNTMPGLTSLSHYPAMWAAVGIPYPQLLGLLVERAIAVSSA
jgi:D-alanine-D-alanine ligase